MTVAQIIAMALDQCHTKSGQVSSTNLLSYFNIARKELGNAIIKDVDENFFFEIWKRDAVADQENGEYPYPEADNDSAGMLKALGVFIKPYSTDIDYKKALEVDIKSLPYDWAYYLTNQPKTDPIYFLGDNSVFIAPQFVAADLPASPSGNVQIKINGLVKFIDLAADAAATAILIPDDSHHRIAIGMKQFIFMARGKRNEALSAKQEFEIEKAAMIDELTNRDNSGMTAKLPNDTGLGFAE